MFFPSLTKESKDLTMAVNVGIANPFPPTSLLGPVNLGPTEAYPTYDWGFGGGCDYDENTGFSSCGSGFGGEWSTTDDGYYQECPDDYYQEVDSYAICDSDNLIFSENDCSLYGENIGGCYDSTGNCGVNNFGNDNVGWEDSVECADNFGAPCGTNAGFDGMCASGFGGSGGGFSGGCDNFDVNANDVPDPTLTDASSFSKDGNVKLTKPKPKPNQKPNQKLNQKQKPNKKVSPAPIPVEILKDLDHQDQQDQQEDSLLISTRSTSSHLVTTASTDPIIPMGPEGSQLVTTASNEIFDDIDDKPRVSTASKKSIKQSHSRSKSIHREMPIDEALDGDEQETKTAELFSNESDAQYTLAVMASNKLVSVLTLNNYSVQDVCGFDTAIFILLNNGDILRLVPKGPSHDALLNGDYDITPIKNNVRLQQIVTFGGYLYGVSRGKLYLLDSRTYEFPTRTPDSLWKWDPVTWAPSNIIHANTTLIGDHLLLTTEESGYLYSIEGATHQNPKFLEKFSLAGKQRVYGATPKNYLEIDPSKNVAVKRPDNEKVSNIKIGALTYDGDIIRISPSLASKVKAIRIINWHPYYIVRED